MPFEKAPSPLGPPSPQELGATIVETQQEGALEPTQCLTGISRSKFPIGLRSSKQDQRDQRPSLTGSSGRLVPGSCPGLGVCTGLGHGPGWCATAAGEE